MKKLIILWGLVGLMSLSMGTGCSSDDDDKSADAGSTDDATDDVVEPEIEDADQDGIADSKDNCVNSKNEQQVDSDEDGYGDACDNCPDVANPDQADFNSNDSGDACTDTDMDTVFDSNDNCPEIINTAQGDEDNDGIGDFCDEDSFSSVEFSCDVANVDAICSAAEAGTVCGATGDTVCTADQTCCLGVNASQQLVASCFITADIPAAQGGFLGTVCEGVEDPAINYLLDATCDETADCGTNEICCMGNSVTAFGDFTPQCYPTSDTFTVCEDEAALATVCIDSSDCGENALCCSPQISLSTIDVPIEVGACIPTSDTVTTCNDYTFDIESLPALLGAFGG